MNEHAEPGRRVVRRPEGDVEQSVTSDSFVLNRPTQVSINAFGAAVARNAYVDLHLVRSSAPATPPTLFSTTDIDSTVTATYQVGASLWLPPGTYEWYAAVVARGGGVVSGQPITGRHSLGTDSAQSFSAGVSGSRNGYCTVSVGTTNRFATSAASVTGRLQAGDACQAYLMFADVDGNGGGRSRAALAVGPCTLSLRLEGLQHALQPGIEYQFQADFAEYPTVGELVARVSVSG